ncbi:amidohydrolase [Massilia horti]|uniref:Amidohydrolase n=1 Tax=Massilia horti TaxID=2562153 RepID=A0A4Y9T5N4_9BURK|nr:amidohydrolase [Massilia horti]TFW36166.1 amidohydrolase [Massilia horti]
MPGVRVASRVTFVASLFLAPFSAANATEAPSGFGAQIDAVYPSVEALYIDLHRNPELSMNEHQTAKKLAERVRALGYEVTTGVGGTGIVALLRNGPGPVVMLRTEMDALPLKESTGLPFASSVVVRNAAGQEVPVMHACGHDLHMAAWYGTAQLMAANRQAWSGTLMLVGQPGEEMAAGAAAMLKDGLFTRFPKPDYAFTVHDDPILTVGKIGYHAGPFRASADAVNITIFGRGGHGSAPHESRDPIVAGARIVLALQTLVSRENNPMDPVVITVGSFHGGSRSNIIPDEVRMELSVRAFTEEVRKRVLASIGREVKGVALAAGLDREPLIEIPVSVPAIYNDPELIARVVPALQRALGVENVVDMGLRMASDDFTYFGRAGVKAAELHVGAVTREQQEAAHRAGQPLPVPHSPLWAPAYQSTLKVAMNAQSAILMDLLQVAR